MRWVWSTALLAINISLVSYIACETTSILSPQKFRLVGAETTPVIDFSSPCGPASAAVVSCLLDKPKSLKEANQCIRTDPLGRSSMEEVIVGLRAMGFRAEGIRLTPGDLRMLPNSALILFAGSSHFMAALTTGSRTLVALDPPRPAYTVDVDALGDDWNGEAVLVSTTREQLVAQLRILGLPEP